MRQPSRLPYALMFLAIAGLLGFSLYLQFYQGIMPCPLCSLQRIAFVLMGLFVLLTLCLVRFRFGRLLFNSLTLVTAILGIVFAGRQIWLQHFPPTASNECTASLQYMLQVLPMNEVIQKIFTGSTECADQVWQFMGLNMAEWAIGWFIGFVIVIGYLVRRDILRR